MEKEIEKKKVYTSLEVKELDRLEKLMLVWALDNFIKDLYINKFGHSKRDLEMYTEETLNLIDFIEGLGTTFSCITTKIKTEEL